MKFNNTKLTPREQHLVEEYSMMAFKLISVWYEKYPFLGYDDIHDRCIQSLINAARVYDPEKGNFSTLLYRVVERRMINGVRDLNAKKRKGIVVSMQAKLIDDGSQYEELIGIDDNYEFINKDLISYAYSFLSERELSIIKMAYIENITQQEIADRLSISQVHVSRVARKAIQKLRKEMAGV